MKNFIKEFENTLKKRWNELAVGDYGGHHDTYAEMAEKIAVMHEMWQAAGLNKGDKIAISARSSKAWAETFFGAITGGDRKSVV